jgi:hypothetical protein
MIPALSVVPAPAFMTLKVKIGNQYGQRVIHPACEKSIMFCDLLQTKTLVARHIEKIKLLGYTIEVIQDLPQQL